jgi:hypothetical protein
MRTTEKYKNREGSFPEFWKIVLIKMIPRYILILTFVIVLNYFQNGQNSNNYIVLPLTVVIVLGALFVGLYISKQRQKQIFESYELLLDDSGITRNQYNTQTISVRYGDIKEITKNADGSITIKVVQNADVIGIPKQIDGLAQLELRLSEIMPVTALTTTPFTQKYQGIVSLVTLLLYGAVFISDDKFIVGVCGGLLIALLGYSFVKLQRNKNVDKTTKSLMWIVVWVMISLIGTICFKLLR